MRDSKKGETCCYAVVGVDLNNIQNILYIENVKKGCIPNRKECKSK